MLICFRIQEININVQIFIIYGADSELIQNNIRTRNSIYASSWYRYYLAEKSPGWNWEDKQPIYANDT